jgi:serine/threonine protein kinase HipA of HipAB toxin-antitoxin module
MNLLLEDHGEQHDAHYDHIAGPRSPESVQLIQDLPREGCLDVPDDNEVQDHQLKAPDEHYRVDYEH